MTLWLLGLITGLFIHAGWTHQQARKDLCILAYLQEHGPSLGLDMVLQLFSVPRARHQRSHQTQNAFVEEAVQGS